MKARWRITPVLLVVLVVQLVVGCAAVTPAHRRPPNVVLIYADDLGYGDASCSGATAIATPHIDRLAREGLRFTDAHCTSATCTPSRYALLTGEYPWRRRGTGVLPGNAPLLIEPGRLTLPGLLQKAGYQTGVVGKWHLGLGTTNLDWNGPIKPGPLELGFNYAFLMPATGDRVPCVYVENHRVVGLQPNDPLKVSFAEYIGDEPTGKKNPELLRVHPSHGPHRPAGPWRGGKYSIFEGGTRVPFIVCWPGRVQPGVSSALMSQVDLAASLSALTGQVAPAATMPDSQNHLAALMGETAVGRSNLIEHAGGLAVRSGSWKFIPPRPGVKRLAATNIETGNDANAQLYDLSSDPDETNNLATAEPGKVLELRAILEAEKARGFPAPLPGEGTNTGRRTAAAGIPGKQGVK